MLPTGSSVLPFRWPSAPRPGCPASVRPLVPLAAVSPSTLAEYLADVEYLLGSHNIAADALSKAPISSVSFGIDFDTLSLQKGSFLIDECLPKKSVHAIFPQKKKRKLTSLTCFIIYGKIQLCARGRRTQTPNEVKFHLFIIFGHEQLSEGSATLSPTWSLSWGTDMTSWATGCTSKLMQIVQKVILKSPGGFRREGKFLTEFLPLM